MNFMLIDSDRSNLDMLRNLIHFNELGLVLVQMDRGDNLLEEILFYHPDLIIMESKIGTTDGIEVLKKCRKAGYQGNVIMYSDDSSLTTITQAYENGVTLYIRKPAPPVELLMNIRRIEQQMEMERTLSDIRGLLHPVQDTSPADRTISFEVNVMNQFDPIFADLGLIGTAGLEEIRAVLIAIYHDQAMNPGSNDYRLNDIYEKICIDMYGEKEIQQNLKSMKQRIRRAILKVLAHLAELGTEDYYDPVFTRYSGVLFDFKQVRQEMQHVKDPTAYHGKINTKKFMEGILSKISI